MDVTTAWVKPPRQIGGLDHLAVQAPCINIYGRLLPGITNVTDRARYYSFYPWLIWALEQAGYTRFDDRFIDAFRKADGLFTLIAHRHAANSKDAHENHAGATVGSANLASHISTIKAGGEITLSDYAHRDTQLQSYFKNKLGGLGQYYLGVLAELSILDGNAADGVRCTRERGLLLAKAMDKSVPRALFIRTIEEGKVSAERLDALKTFCPCQIKASGLEAELLRKLFFSEAPFEDSNAGPRCRSLRMLLSLAENLSSQGLPLDSGHFRGCVYSEALPDGTPWQLDEGIAKNRSLWGIYQRNELLSVAVQGLFYAVLDAYEESALVLHNSAAVAHWFVHESEELKELDGAFQPGATFSELVAASQSWLPGYAQWGEELHEVTQAEQIIALCKKGKSASQRAQIVAAAVRVLIALAVRPDTRNGYGSIVFPANYLSAYPINLGTFLIHIDSVWGQMPLEELLSWLFAKWGIEVHLSVALRKLRGQNQSTFRIQPSDRGMEVVEIPQAVHTSPRFSQATRVLKDLNLLTDDSTISVCTELGKHYKGVQNEH
jgi:hypothetical protein